MYYVRRRVITPNNRDMSTISLRTDCVGNHEINSIRDNTPPSPNGRYRDKYSVTGYRNVRRSVQHARNSK